MLVAPAAVAQAVVEGWHGSYAGGGASYSNVRVERPGSYCEDCYYFDLPSYDEGDGDFSFVAHVGYRVGRYFGVEAAWRDTGTIGWSKDHVWMPDLDSDTSIQHVSLKMQYRFGARQGTSPVSPPQPQGSPAPPQ